MTHNSDEGLENERKYANYFVAGYNAADIVLDCGQFYGESAPALFHTHLVMAPLHAIHLLEVLRQTVAEYEAEYGATSRLRNS